MQGIALPLAIAVLLAAPLLWRLGGDVRESPAVRTEEANRPVAQPLSPTSRSLRGDGWTDAVPSRSRHPARPERHTAARRTGSRHP